MARPDRVSSKLLALFLTFVLCFLFQPTPSHAAQPDKNADKTSKQLNVGIVTWVGFAPLFVSVNKGYFKKNGLNVRVSIIEDEASRRSAFVSGQLDLAANTVDALASSAPSGINGVVILKADDSFGADGLIVRKSIPTIHDLKGKKVAFPKGLPSHYFLHEILKDNHMTIKDIIPVYMEASDAGAAFAAGKIDAAVTWEPWLSQGLSTGNILATTKDKPGFIVDVLMASPTSLTSKRTALKLFVEQWFKGLQFIKDNPTETYEIVSSAMKLSVPEVKELLSLVSFADLDANKRFLASEMERGSCSDLFFKATEFWYSEGVISKKSAPNRYCNGALIEDISR